MKISNLLNEYEKHQYVLGNIFSNAHFNKNKTKIFFISKSKIQKTNKNYNIKEGYENYKNYLLKKGYEAKLLNETNYLSFSKNDLGVLISFENDLNLNEKKLIDKIYKNYISKNKENFIRGIFDSSSSVDSSVGYITRDLLKNCGEDLVYYLANILSNFFNYTSLNLNPRFKQPSNISKSKNTQFRLKFRDFFTLIGTERQVTINVFEKKFFKFKKMDDFNWEIKNGVYYIDMSHLIKFSSKNDQKKLDKKLNEVLKDFKVNSDYKKGIKNRDFLALKYSEVYFLNKENKRKNYRPKIPFEIQEELLNDSNFCDNLTGEPLYKKDSNKRFSKNNVIVDIHHIIPWSKRHIFKKENLKDENLEKISNDPRNLIVLNPTTHTLLHRATFVENKVKFEKLYKIIFPYLKYLKITLSFNQFCNLYN